jgi:hypothetical protein
MPYRKRRSLLPVHLVAAKGPRSAPIPRHPMSRLIPNMPAAAGFSPAMETGKILSPNSGNSTQFVPMNPIPAFTKMVARSRGSRFT